MNSSSSSGGSVLSVLAVVLVAALAVVMGLKNGPGSSQSGSGASLPGLLGSLSGASGSNVPSGSLPLQSGLPVGGDQPTSGSLTIPSHAGGITSALDGQLAAPPVAHGHPAS